MVTVALPTWRGQHILWLQLESLCRQKTDERWQLIVYACDWGESASIVRKYSKRLYKAGMCGMEIMQSKTRLPLGEKWRAIAKKAAGEAFILAASDNFSPPNRIELTHKAIIEEGHDWMDCSSGLFYDISTGAKAQWERRKGQTGLWMATRTEHIKSLEGAGPKKGIDGWIGDGLPDNARYKHIDEPLDGVHTDGCNTISSYRKNRYSRGGYSHNFRSPLQKARRILPQDVWYRLKEMRG